MTDDILTFLKLLADSTRLNLIGLLAQEPRSVDELAVMLDLSASTVSYHLSRLHEAGLVVARTQQYYSIYALKPEPINRYAALLTPEHFAQRAQINGAVDPEAYTRQILARWIHQERLKDLPTQVQHRRVVLMWLVEKLETDVRYSQNQLWEVLEPWSIPEISTEAIRALVDGGFLARLPDGQWYWRSDSPQARTSEKFTADLLPQAETVTGEPWERWRDGRLLVSEDPRRQRLNLLALAMRLKSGKHYVGAEVDAIIQKYSEGDPVTLRSALVHEGIVQQSDDGTYWRTHKTPDHPAVLKQPEQ